jgi:hypothetical protein
MKNGRKQKKTNVQDKEEKNKEERINLNTCSISVLITFCVWKQSIAYMEIYLQWIFPIAFNSVTTMFCFAMLLSLLCSDNKSLH